MAILKSDGYSDLHVETGDAEIDGEEKDQLKVTVREVVSAINAENLADKVFGRILANRNKSFKALADKIPGAKLE